VPGTKVMFSVWETRVRDYAAYAAANSGVDNTWRNPRHQGVPVTPSEDCPGGERELGGCQGLLRVAGTAKERRRQAGSGPGISFADG